MIEDATKLMVMRVYLCSWLSWYGTAKMTVQKSNQMKDENVKGIALYLRIPMFGEGRCTIEVHSTHRFHTSTLFFTFYSFYF